MNNHDLIEKDKKRAQTQRHYLLYLILNHLKQHGYGKSCETLFAEAQLSNDVQVCDNVDLEMILMEYDSYYYVKFNRYPTLCKKINGVPAAEGKRVRSTPSKQGEAKSSDGGVKEKPGHQAAGSNPADNVNLAVTVTPIFPIENNEQVVTNEKVERSDQYSSMYKLIESLYPADSEQRKIAEDLSREIVVENLNVHWSDVLGLTECKNAVMQATVYPLKYPALFNDKFTPWKGILLYGPPGTGKTMLAKAVATECKCTFFNITASSLVSKWRGDSEKYIRVLFELAYRRSPSIIFIDEIDWIATKEKDDVLSEPARRFRAELLSRLDGLISYAKSNVLLLATTNAPWNIDAALLRRLEKRVYVPLPNGKTRDEILRHHVSNDIMVSYSNEMVRLTEGFSGADLLLLCKEAWINQITPFWEQLEAKKISLQDVNYEIESVDHFNAALKCMKVTAANTNDKYAEWERKLAPKRIVYA